MFKLAVFAFGLDAIIAVANALVASNAFMQNLAYLDGSGPMSLIEIALIPLGAIAYAFVAIALFYWAPRIIQRLFSRAVERTAPGIGA